ncbi:hypothetical protein JCM10213_005941 [Rhodosporidiobolus nylandii]
MVSFERSSSIVCAPFWESPNERRRPTSSYIPSPALVIQRRDRPRDSTKGLSNWPGAWLDSFRICWRGRKGAGACSSGVGVNSECLDTFQSLKLGKKLKYIIFKLSDDFKEIVVEKSSESGDYEEFINDLPPSTPRYAIYDFEYEKGEGKRNKICFYAWSPDEAKIKEKMLYASSKDALRRSLVGIATEVQGTDFDEVAYEAILDKVSRGTA